MTRSLAQYDTYLATGDSLTGGYFTSEADGSKRFVALVAASLQSLGYASQVAIHPNPGAGIDTALISLRSTLNRYEPQIMTVEWGINNINASMAAATFQAKYSDLLDLILESGSNRIVVCCNIPWFGYASGSVSWNLALQYNVAIAAEANARNLPLADCWSPTALQYSYLSSPSVTYYYPTTHVGDYAHPNNDGHQAIHDAIWAVMEPALDGRSQNILTRPTATTRPSAATRPGASGRGEA